MSPLYFLALSWMFALKTAPLAGWAIAAADAPLLQRALAPETAELEFSGEPVDGDLPATYRLPSVSPLPPSAAESDAPVPLFFPPLPPEVYEPAPTTSVDVAAAPRAAAGPGIEPSECFSANPESTRAGSPPDERSAAPADSAQPAPAAAAAQRVAGPALPAESAALEVVPCAPATTDRAAQLLPAVQRGYVLAQRGALFAARTEFVQVLRRVAQAKDVAAACDEHSQALAAGLRALDEAEDFVPAGVQLEAELDVRATASSHRTPALPENDEQILPHEAVARYHDFAQEQLARAVTGDQAGSMALYGLGRIDAQLAERHDDDVRFVRGAMTMYAAALAACPHNHLAANELGVLRCRTGRPAEAVKLFQRTIDLAPSATAYHNLAVAQQKLGLHATAHANEQESQRLAAWERAQGALSRRAGVRWVAPEELARVAQPAALTPTPIQAAASPAPKESAWQRAVGLTRALPRPGAADSINHADDATHTHVVWPASIPNNSRWR
jgi:tetratricopeptide (TPR) repeat protein